MSTRTRNSDPLATEDEFDDDLEVFDTASGDEREIEDEQDGSDLTLFDGDDGSLTLEQRRALVAILTHRFITAEQNPAEWRVLRSSRQQLKTRLNDMFLDLYIDEGFEVAYKRQAAPEVSGRAFPTLLRDHAYSREETILLIYLRRRFQAERAVGHSDVTVEESELFAHIQTFRPAHSNDPAGDTKRASNAIASLERARILIRTNDQARLRISPVVPALLPLARLRELHEWLREENAAKSRRDDGPGPIPATRPAQSNGESQ